MKVLNNLLKGFKRQPVIVNDTELEQDAWQRHVASLQEQGISEPGSELEQPKKKSATNHSR